MTELVPRARLSVPVPSRPFALAADPDGRVRIPKFTLDNGAFTTGRVRVECEISWDGEVWQSLGEDVFEAGAQARDGGPPSVSMTLQVWGEDDKPRSPVAARWWLSAADGSPTAGATIQERRDPNAKPQQRHHSIAIVQSAEKQVTASTSTTLAYGSNVVQNNLLTVVHACSRSGTNAANTINTPTDSISSSYAAITAQVDIGTNIISLRGYYAVGLSSAADTVTASQANSGDFSITIAEFSGTATGTPLDTSNSGTGNGTAVSSGDVTPSEDNCLLLAGMTHGGTNRTLTEEAGWNLVQEHEGGTSDMPMSVVYKVQTTATTEDADWTIGTGAVDWGAMVGVFKAAAAATTIKTLIGGGFIEFAA